jgi:hypothetical protein
MSTWHKSRLRGSDHLVHNLSDEGLTRQYPRLRLRIGGRGCQMNSKVKIQTNKAKLDVCLRQSLVFRLNLDVSLAGLS